MDEEKNKWEKLVNLTEEYDPDPNLANEVLAKINQRESTVKFRRRLPLFIALALFLACAVFLAIFLPLYLSPEKPNPNPNPVEDIFYSADSIDYDDISDLQGFVNDNGLKLHYYSTGMEMNQTARLKETRELVYIVQETVLFTETSMDEITLNIVLIPNAEFDFCKNYSSLPLTASVSGISVQYLKDTKDTFVYRAKFTYEDITYYLEINTVDDSADKLEEYINTLIN